MIYDVYNLGTGDDVVAALGAGAIRGELRISRRFSIRHIEDGNRVRA